jgi:hypothetical protein
MIIMKHGVSGVHANDSRSDLREAENSSFTNPFGNPVDTNLKSNAFYPAMVDHYPDLHKESM